MLPRLWPRLLHRVKQRCRTRRVKVGTAIERLEELVLLTDRFGIISTDTVWTNAEVQRITGDVTILAGATLTVEPGTVVKFNAGLRLIVDGTLVADGNTGERINFTSVKDDTGLDGMLGTGDDSDTNGDGTATTPAAGDWTQIEIAAGGTAGRTTHFVNLVRR